ncbi:MAG: leucine-rich repeat protein [Tenericutes bacterium]|nr:leucine-rich repeat protein [Mycoplasmatota bacterium]
MKRNAFTLIELLAVIGILGILILAVVPNVIKIYNNALLKTMETQEANVKNASKLYVEDYCIDPIDNTYICPSSYENVVNNERYVCLNKLQSGSDKYIGNITYKNKSCTGVVVYTKDTSGSYSNSKTYLYCGYDEENNSYSYMTDPLLNVSKYSACNIVSVASTENCFAFDSSTGTITGYGYGWDEEYDELNASCPLYVNIPSKIGGVDVVTIGGSSFSRGEGENSVGKLIEITIPNSVVTIEGYAFEYNSLENVIIPNSVTSIESCAFRNNNLTSVVIPDSVMSIGYDAFSHNDLNSVTIGSGLSSISTNPFLNNPNLTNVVVDNNNPNYMSSNSAIYTKDGKTLILGNQTSANNILNTTTRIAQNAFSYNNLTTVTIPSSVTNIDDFAFYNNKLTSLTIPNSVVSIGDYTFYNNKLTNVSISNSVTSIGSFSFARNLIPQGSFLIDNNSSNISIGSYALYYNGTNGNTTITPTYLR